MANRALIGQSHSVGGQHAGKAVNHDGFHAELIGNETRVLSSGAAEALQREVGDVVSLLERNLFNGLGHVGDRDAQKALRDGARVLSLPGGRCDLG